MVWDNDTSTIINIGFFVRRPLSAIPLWSYHKEAYLDNGTGIVIPHHKVWDNLDCQYLSKHCYNM